MMACDASVEDAIDLVDEKVYWEKISFSLPVVILNNQTSREILRYLGKTFCAIKESPDIWNMKHNLLADQFHCAILE